MVLLFFCFTLQVLVANKCDLLKDVASSFVAGAKMESACRQHGFAGWFVTSAKMGDNVESCMCFLSRQMLAARDIQRAKVEQNFLKTVADTGFGGSGGGGGATRAYYLDEEVEDLVKAAPKRQHQEQYQQQQLQLVRNHQFPFPSPHIPAGPLGMTRLGKLLTADDREALLELYYLLPEVEGPSMFCVVRS